MVPKEYYDNISEILSFHNMKANPMVVYELTMAHLKRLDLARFIFGLQRFMKSKNCVSESCLQEILKNYMCYLENRPYAAKSSILNYRLKALDKLREINA